MLALQLNHHSLSRLPAARGDGFFRFHGWMAPGVRLFRRLRFPAKSGAISFAFMAPLALVLYYLWSAGMGQVHTARSERAGVVYSDALLTLVEAAQRRRLAEVGGAELAEARRGDEFHLKPAYAAMLAAREQARGGADDAAATDKFDRHSGYVDKLLSLMRASPTVRSWRSIPTWTPIT